MSSPTPMSGPQDTNRPNRGRGSTSFPSRRGGSRTRGGGRNYGSPSVQQEAKQQQERIQSILDENIKRSAEVKSKREDVSEYIEQGKTLVSKFFKGFEQEKRGNIQVTIDDTLPERISDIYLERLDEQAADRFRSDDAQVAEQRRKRYIKRFAAGITLGTAIKLYRSSTELEKSSNYSLNVLHQTKLQLPEKAAVIINQLGKTDLKDDNRIRIMDQNMAAKRMLVKAVCRYFHDDDLDVYLTDANDNGVTVAQLYNNVFGENFPKMIDNKLASIKLLKDIGREYFTEKGEIDYEVSVNSISHAQQAQQPEAVAFTMRLPKYNFEAENQREELRRYLANPIFSLEANRHFKFENQVDNDYQQKVINVVCSLVFQIAQPSWIRQPNRRMSAIDTAFANTFIGNATFINVMNQVGVWNINNWITDVDLNELGMIVLGSWNTNESIYLSQVLKMKEVAFSEFGTDSQMVEMNKSSISNEFYEGISRCSIKRKPQSKVGLKISETGAIFGVMAKFINKMKIRSDFKVVHDSTNRNILREFLKTDFKY